MATASQLKALRKKHGLGEFRKKKGKKRRQPWKKRHRSYHKANKRYGPLRRSRPRKRTATHAVGTTYPSSGSARMPLGPTFPGSPFNQYTDSEPTAVRAISGAAIANPMSGQLGGDQLVRTEEGNGLVMGYFMRPDGSLYKKLI
jgi:hypothetical protein